MAPATRKTIFDKLKKGLKKQCPPMVISKNKAGTFAIMGNKPVPHGSKKKIVPGMYFSSAVSRKDMVSFYLFPVYYHQKEFFDIAPTAMKCLKGKTCFNFKKEEEIVEHEIDALLSKGAMIWSKLGYMK